MRFSKLGLTGFKSFVDPAELIIADGLTGIVGPNGCGKSNLLEALRWVMGENRPSAMRGGGMEDVIFAGAASRPARNFAEVSIHIDNSDRLAPAGFNDTDELHIVRRITRDAGSAYSLNARDVRARDVQMLFADAATGAHSPSLVRQGEIAELINARPKARRRILEEAAGISGLYQRRHEAELKLKGAETNLARVDDVLEQLASQLAQLARQARQAARYRQIGAALRRTEALLLYRRWNESDAARAVAEAGLRARTKAAAQAEAAAVQAGKARAVAEAALPPLREEETIAAALLQRASAERDALSQEEMRTQQAINTLTAQARQLSEDKAREETLNQDANDTIARLEQDARALEQAGDGHAARLAEAAEQARAAAAVLREREAQQAKATEDAAQVLAREQSAQRLVERSRKAVARSEAEAAKAQARVAQGQAALARAQAALDAAKAAGTQAQRAAETAEAVLNRTDAERGRAQTQEAEARAQRSAAESEAGALQAELSALTRLVAQERAEGGQVLDLVTVSPGYEKALGAALADDLRTPVVGADGPSGWRPLQAYPGQGSSGDAELPPGIVPLRLHVDVPEVLNRRLAQIGIVDADTGNRLQAGLRPGQRLVSLDGDLWRWDGFRVRAQSALGAAALRLQQVNRLKQLKQAQDRARARAAEARQAHETLGHKLALLVEADKRARTARREADQAAAQANRTLSNAEADSALARGRLETMQLAITRHQEEATAARVQLQGAEAELAGSGDPGAARDKVAAIRQAVEAARVTMMARQSGHDALRRDGDARAARAQAIGKELGGWRHRLKTAGKRIAELDARRAAATDGLRAVRAVPGELAARRVALADSITAAGARLARARDALGANEGALRAAATAERDAERTASAAREALAAARARSDAAQEQVVAAAERIAEERQTTPERLLPDQPLQALHADPAAIPTAAALEAEANRHRRQRDALGAVNLRAEEDARSVQEEHDRLLHEKTDLAEAIQTLHRGIASLNREGRERLLTAFEQVNANFAMLFTHLFAGGEAKLVMVEGDDPLDAGLEIMCQPPGKKLSTLSLLSGGEQTLTAMALIFAVFLANPAPICVLDEVDAPLDDTNVALFCDLLDEMCRRTRTRFLIITHHAVTMARMDRLFGVTMAEKGVSQLVSVDLSKAGKMMA